MQEFLWKLLSFSLRIKVGTSNPPFPWVLKSEPMTTPSILQSFTNFLLASYLVVNYLHCYCYSIIYHVSNIDRLNIYQISYQVSMYYIRIQYRLKSINIPDIEDIDTKNHWSMSNVDTNTKILKSHIGYIY